MFYMNMKVFNESSGNHGLMGRIAKEKYEAEKKRNDEHDKNIEKKREQYKKAGYEDKAPMPANRSKEENLKQLYKDDRDNRYSDKTAQVYKKFYADSSLYKKSGYYNDNKAASDIASEYDTRKKENDSKVNHKLHDRINNRTKHESAGIFDCLEML